MTFDPVKLTVTGGSMKYNSPSFSFSSSVCL